MHLLEYKITGVKNLPVVDSMKTDMNFITGQTYYINPDHIAREKSDVSLED